MDQLGKQLDLTPVADGPFFSPDGEWIGFFSATGDLMRISIKGGAPSHIADIASRQLGGSWGSDDTIVFASNLGLYRVPAEGGEPEQLVAPNADDGELYYAWPQFLPGRRANLEFRSANGNRP